MLDDKKQTKLTAKEKEFARDLLRELEIVELNDDNIGKLQNALDVNISALVSAKEDGEAVDNELIKIYDLITDIVLDNEEDFDFLNRLFFN